MTPDTRVALVTGAGQGIGRAVALELAARGDTIVVNDVNESTGAETVALVERGGGRAVLGLADVTDALAVASMVEDAGRAVGAVDVLVNNAGGAPPGAPWGPFVATSVETHERFLALNLLSAFICTRAVLAGMVERSYGKVVCVSSISGVLGQRGGSAYAAAKAGLVGFVASVAKEVAARGVNVNVITIGNAPHPSRKPERAAELSQWNHLGREGRHDEFAKAIAFLVSDDASYLSGSNLVVDGGTLRLATL
jgi:NAD(P)-dependent dehydrogenase (short-subunit alcohol dehydrogenase family)